MLIKDVVQKEARRNQEMIFQYEALISSLPKGSLICRKNEYYYLKYRDGDKIRDEYIGKNPDIVSSLRKKLEERKHYSQMLYELRKEQKVIHKILEELV